MKAFRSLSSHLPAITLLAGLFFAASPILSGTVRAAPLVSLSPAVGPPKTTVNVSGTGIGANALVIRATIRSKAIPAAIFLAPRRDRSARLRDIETVETIFRSSRN